MFCKKCGSKLNGGEKFCTKCSGKTNFVKRPEINHKSTSKKWILIVAVICISLWIVAGILIDTYENSESESIIISADKVSIPGFIKYSGEENDLNFSILFPTDNPEIYNLDLGDISIKGYQAHDIINLEEKKFVQYNVFFSEPKKGKILSEESIKAYLINYPDGKSSFNNGFLIEKEMRTFKGLIAVEYTFSSEMYETKIIHRGIVFIVDGIPVELSVVYTNLTSESKVYYNDYIKSFAISYD